MANYFNIILDTLAPANPSITIEGGSSYATQQLVNLTIGTSDGDTTGYSMRIWGDVDNTYNTDVQSVEVNSNWITYQTSFQLKLSSGDGNKTIYIKIRDDVHNVSSQASDSIILDTTLPVVTVSGVSVGKISKVSGKNIVTFSFQSDSIFDEYKVKVVSTTGASHDTGTLIGITNGSINMSGNAGSYPASTPINSTINGTDLELANAGDGQKIIKVFVKDKAGNWSV